MASSIGDPSRRVDDWLQETEFRGSGGTRSSNESNAESAKTLGKQNSESSEEEANRSSLEDILSHDRTIHESIPQYHHLPSSHDDLSWNIESFTTSSAACQNPGNDTTEKQRSSLEEITHHSKPIVPSAISLPQSQSSPRVPYKKVIENASEALDHIRRGNILLDSRHEKTSILCYDYTANMQQMPVATKIDDPNRIHLLGNVQPNIKQRVILVEDLSKETIHALGDTFGMNPEFFEQHLLNSGYGGADFEQPSSQSWKTASFPKSFFTLRWYRPVWRKPTPFSEGGISELLQNSTTRSVRLSKVTTRIMTNIFRSEWSLCTDPTQSFMDGRHCGWEEKVTIWTRVIDNQDCQIIVVLLDPLPRIVEQWRVLEEDGELDDEGRRNERELRANRQGDEEVGDIRPSQPRHRYVERGLREKFLLEQISPRYQDNTNLDHVFSSKSAMLDFKSRLSQIKSTGHDLDVAISKQTCATGIASLLIQVFVQDTFALLRQLNRIADEIDIDILDETKVEDRLSLWRQIINKAQRELPELMASIESLSEFDKKNTDFLPLPGTRIPYQSLDMISNEIGETSKRLKETSASLTSNLTLLESKRSIAEAQAVARLTELAFIFIPLSFAATVFGMQIESFADPAPNELFFLVAIVTILFAYLMRLFMRSQWLEDLKANTNESIRGYAERHGYPIRPRFVPTRLITRWGVDLCRQSFEEFVDWALEKLYSTNESLFQKMGLVMTYFLLTGLLSTVPTVILWSRPLDSGIRLAVSLGIVFTVASIVLAFVMYRFAHGN